MFDRVEAELGMVTRLVGNAGTTSRFNFPDLPPEEWQRLMDINLTGNFHVVQRAIGPMLARGRGSIVLVTTQATLTGGGGGAHYAASKAGVEGLARHLTKELRPRGIRVNVVQPSAIDTELFRERYPDPRDRETVAADIPAGRLGHPDDIAYAVVFLLSDLADYICGQCLLVDGGRTMFR
jgi:3-oxoacyl-[acyl-carrier protein] reductase